MTSKNLKNNDTALGVVGIQVIPHKDQRYPTVGDWFYDKDGNLMIKVSDLGDWRYNMLVAVHELVEVLLCKQAGVSQEEVDKFDIQYETDRPEGSVDEPGDDLASPYREQHCIATGVERILAAGLGVSWNEYAAKIESLP